MLAFSRFANPLLATRFLNVIKGGLPSSNDFSKDGGSVHIGTQNLANFPENTVTVYGKLLEECSAKPEKVNSLFASVKDAGADCKILEHTKTVWNLSQSKSE